MSAYYNDNEPFVCDWLRNLIAGGQLADGVVDERDIREVQPEDLRGFERVHLFAGIGGWDLATYLAEWPDDRPVWTASCPCPPFSIAGKQIECPSCQAPDLVWCPRRTGYAICARCREAWLADARHLWPEVWRLVSVCRPPVLFGEQVASGDGVDWYAGVRASLEILGYAVAAPDLPASSVGAPQRRQRLWFVADRDGRGRAVAVSRGESESGGGVGKLADADSPGRWPLDHERHPDRPDGEDLDGKEGAGRPRGGGPLGAAVEHADREGRIPRHDHPRARQRLSARTAGGQRACDALGDAGGARRQERESQPAISGPAWRASSDRAGADGGVVHPDSVGREDGRSTSVATGEAVARGGAARTAGQDGGGVGEPALERRREGPDREPEPAGEVPAAVGEPALRGRPARGDEDHEVGDAGSGPEVHEQRPGRERGLDPWESFELVYCSYDGRPRRIEPGTFPLASGVPRRVDILRAYGNAIVPQVAARVMRWYLEKFPSA